jgi:hypothetical protein
MDVTCPQCGAVVTVRGNASGGVTIIDPTAELIAKCPWVQARPVPRSVDDFMCPEIMNAIGHAVMRTRP